LFGKNKEGVEMNYDRTAEELIYYWELEFSTPVEEQ